MAKKTTTTKAKSLQLIPQIPKAVLSEMRNARKAQQAVTEEIRLLSKEARAFNKLRLRAKPAGSGPEVGRSLAALRKHYGKTVARARDASYSLAAAWSSLGNALMLPPAIAPTPKKSGKKK